MKKNTTYLKQNKSPIELRMTEEKGDGVYSNVQFFEGNTVLVGIIVRGLKSSDSRAYEVSKNRFVLLAGLFPKVNHSCDPNCGVRVNPESALDLVARKNIYDDDEITIDYSMTNMQLENFPEKCLCGTALCRKEITGWIGLPDSTKKTYKGLVSPCVMEE
jgi:hypothetical protein